MTSPYRDSDLAPPAPREDVLLTTCDHIEGYRVVCYFGLIHWTVFSSHPFATAAIKARGEAAIALVARAHKLNANAVVGLRYDSNIDGTSNFYEVTVYGTAVRIEPVPPTGPTK